MSTDQHPQVTHRTASGGRSTSTSAPGATVSKPRRHPLRRVLVGLVSLVVVLALLLLGGGGWYFSGQIYEDGLRVSPHEPDYAMEVEAVAPGTVTIGDPEDTTPVLDGDAVYGIYWKTPNAGAEPSGYGRLTGQGTTAPAVTRDLEVLSGRAPGVGDLVADDRAAYPQDPQVALGMPVEDVVVEGDGAAFPAWYVPGDRSTWAVLVHGKGGDRAEMLRMMDTTVDVGMPSLAVTYRNDVGVLQDASGMYQFGLTEWPDLQAAVDHAVANGAEDVVLVATSHGAAVAAAYLRNVPDAPVSALVLDSPMLDFGETVSWGASQRVLPVVGQVPDAVTWSAKRLASVRYGVDWEALDYLSDTSWLDVPTLVLHGTADPTVPVTLSEQLAEQQPDEVELVLVPGAEHVESWNADPQAYGEALAEFLTR